MELLDTEEIVFVKCVANTVFSDAQWMLKGIPESYVTEMLEERLEYLVGRAIREDVLIDYNAQMGNSKCPVGIFMSGDAFKLVLADPAWRNALIGELTDKVRASGQTSREDELQAKLARAAAGDDDDD